MNKVIIILLTALLSLFGGRQTVHRDTRASQPTPTATLPTEAPTLAQTWDEPRATPRPHLSDIYATLNPPTPEPYPPAYP